MIRKLTLSIALVVAAAMSTIPLHAQTDDDDTIHDELSVMRRILEAKIGDMTNPWQTRVGRSVFDSNIRTDYIPTVGAIVTIPVGFPLRPSGEEETSTAEPLEPEDLWEHFSGDEPTTTSRSAPPRPPKPPGVPSASRVVDVETIIVDGENNGSVSVVPEGSQRPVIYVPVNPRTFRAEEPYDAAKVNRMTQLIIETIAEYGHRMKHLPNSERLLIILEAPQERISITTRIVERVQDVKRDLRDREEREAMSRELASETRQRAHELRVETEALEEKINAREEEINARENEINAREEELREEVEALQDEVRQRQKEVYKVYEEAKLEYGARGQRRHIVGDVDVLDFMFNSKGNANRDKLLLSFKKSDLTKGTDYDRLKNKVEQIDY